MTPLVPENFFYADILPFSNQKALSKKPIYIIQGNINRRFTLLLKNILDKKYKYDFIIKIIGRKRLPESLKKYKNKLVIKNRLNFIDYHRQFLDAYCILPLITKKSKPGYYSKKLTSSINYARGYSLKYLIDRDLQNIYNLEDAQIFNDENDIAHSFEETLKIFYEK